MDTNDTATRVFSPSYSQNPTAVAAVAPTASPTNGLEPHMDPPPMVYTPSGPSESMKKKRGRPRKYATREEALAARKMAASSSTPVHISSPKSRELGSSSAGGSLKKSRLDAIGNAGQGFTPHVINVAAGEDVSQKIMLFMQQSKLDICILSASGSISNASLCQPATSGGSIMHEGRFDILTLCGSYVRTELGGRSGGLSICLSSTDGQIIGGGVGGPLTAAGPVEVIIGAFLLDTKKDAATVVKGDAPVGHSPPPVGSMSVPGVGYRPAAVESSARTQARESDDQEIGGFTIQPRGTHTSPPLSANWGSGIYEFSGRMGRGVNQSSENGQYEQMPD